MLLSTLITIVCLRLNDDLKFLIPIGKIYTITLFLLLIVHVFGLYTFPVSETNVLKGASVQLGFRNINTYGMYCANCVIIFFLFNQRKWYWLAIGLLLVSTYYTKARTPIVTVGIIVISDFLRNYKYLIPKLKSGLFYFSILIVALGAISVIYVKEILSLNFVSSSGLNLNDLTSNRLVIINNTISNFSIKNWFIGLSAENGNDSLYYYFIIFFGVIYSLLLFYLVIRCLIKLKKSNDIKLMIFVATYLTSGLFEMPVSPFIPYALIFFVVLLNTEWAIKQINYKI